VIIRWNSAKQIPFILLKRQGSSNLAIQRSLLSLVNGQRSAIRRQILPGQIAIRLDKI